MKNSVKFAIAAAIVAAVVASSLTLGSSSNAGAGNNNNGEEAKVVRVGYFPNINHAQAVIGFGRGDFQDALGDGVEVKTQIFNAGPSVVEALFASQIDVAYIGPNPAINGYVRSDGQALRIVSGAASGGAVFVVRNDAGIDSAADLAGKTFASPQLGNTQDVALRKYLLENGHRTRENDGDIGVQPAKNADIVTLMIKKDIDGAWVPEPWGAKLVKDTDSRVFLDERDLWPGGEFVTAHIIVRTEFLEQNPEIVKKLVRTNVETTEWINTHPDEAVRIFNEELEKLTGKTVPEDEFREGLSRMELTYDPIKESLFKSANDAYDIGFFDEKPDLSGIYDLDILNEVLAEKGKAPIP